MLPKVISVVDESENIQRRLRTDQKIIFLCWLKQHSTGLFDNVIGPRFQNGISEVFFDIVYLSVIRLRDYAPMPPRHFIAFNGLSQCCSGIDENIDAALRKGSDATFQKALGSCTVNKCRTKRTPVDGSDEESARLPSDIAQ